MKNLNLKIWRGSVVVGALIVGNAFSQPAPIPTGTNPANCYRTAPTVSTQIDTVVSAPDTGGFRSIFDGRSLKGWWENCITGHSSADRNTGGIWLVDSVRGLLFANQNSNGAGSVLTTNKLWGNYELIFDYWPSFGNDGGVFNRMTPTGNTYQTTLDYIGGSSVGGVYFEGGYTGVGRNADPYTYGANKHTINIGTGAGNWTTNTRTLGNPASYGCPTTGCTAANWTAVWDTGGWNQIRVKFYGTGASATNKVHNESWIRKVGAASWVPVISDSVQYATAPNYLGFQIHGGAGSWSNRNGIWFRNIKMRPLTDQGIPIPQTPTQVRRTMELRNGFSIGTDALTGMAGGDYEITLSDVRGRVLERFSGVAGAFRHEFKTPSRGLMVLNLRTAQGSEYFRIARVAE